MTEIAKETDSEREALKAELREELLKELQAELKSELLQIRTILNSTFEGVPNREARGLDHYSNYSFFALRRIYETLDGDNLP